MKESKARLSAKRHCGSKQAAYCAGNQRVTDDGDRDPISAGSVGEAVGGGGSMAEVEMPANPDGAHQVNRHMVGREVVRFLGLRRSGILPIFDSRL